MTSLKHLYYSPAIIIPFHNRMFKVVIFWKYIISCLFGIYSQMDAYPASLPYIYLIYLRQDLVGLYHNRKKQPWTLYFENRFIICSYGNCVSIVIVPLSRYLLLNHSLNEFNFFSTYENCKRGLISPSFITGFL